MGAELVALEPGLCRIRLPFTAGVSQQHGFFHGGVVAAIADSAGGYSALSLCPAGTEVLTVEYKINFLLPAKGPELLATGRVLKAGRTLTVTQVEVEILSEAGVAGCAVLQQTIMSLAS